MNAVSIGMLATFLTCLVTALTFLGIWVYRDAKARGLNAVLWTAVVILLSNGIGLLLYFLIGRKQRMLMCSGCGQRFEQRSRYCPNCGKQAGPEERQATSGRTNKRFMLLAIVFFVAFVIACVGFVVSVVMEEGIDWSGGSGMAIMSTTSSWGNHWDVSFYKSTHVYNKNIKIKNGSPSVLNVEYEYEEGDLFLRITQGEKEELIPLTDMSGQLQCDLSGYDEGKVRLRIENTQVKSAKLRLEWE